MRLLFANCILLGCVVAVLTTEVKDNESSRSKRDLQFWKNLIAAKLGLVEAKPNDENVKIIRIPGFEDVLVRAVPKATVVETHAPTLVKEEIVPVDPTLALLGAYLGTHTPEETLIALQRVKGLLQSGIIKAKEEIIEVMPPKPPVFVLPSAIQMRKPCPDQKHVVPIFQKMPSYPFLTPAMSVPALRPLPVPVMKPLPPIPQVVTHIRPLPLEPVVPLELVPTHYSYKQENGGSVTSFLSKGSDDVIVIQDSTPPPPPPRYIIDRIQKMIYGLPLGSSIRPSLPPIPVVVSKPFVNLPFLPLMHGTVIPQPTPVVAKPVMVDVKVDKDRNKLYHGSVNIFTGSRVMKAPFTSTLQQEQIVVPAPPPVSLKPVPLGSVIADVPLEDENLSYKRVHGDGTISIYSGERVTKLPLTSVAFEDISELPSPPPEIIHRIEEAAGRAHHPESMWGYSFRISNGEGVFENGNNKIFYSRLLPGGNKNGTVNPHPLSSQNQDELRNPNKNVYTVGSDKPKDAEEDKEVSDKDELGDPFLSKKINGETKEQSDSNLISGTQKENKKTQSEPTGTDNSRVKLIPPLPMPIAGENEKVEHSNVIGASNEEDGKTPDFSLTKKNDKGSGTFSYTQIDGGKVTTVSKEKVGGAVLVKEVHKNVPVFPKAVVDVIHPLPRKPATAFVAKIVENIVPVRPSAIVDFVQPVAHPTPDFDLSKQNDKGSGTFSYTQIDEGKVTTILKEKFGGDVLVKETIKNVPVFPKAVVDVIHPLPRNLAAEIVAERVKNIPVPPSAIVDVIQPLAHPEEVAVIGEKHSRVVFPKPVVSSYVYKQLNHNNPKPFTVVNVGEQRIQVPKGDVHVKVNRHEHSRPDGTRYPCTEVHLVPGIPVAPIPAIPTGEVTPTIPKEVLFVPSANAAASPPTGHRKKKPETHFSYTLVTNEAATSNPKPAEATTVKPLSLSENPIVVASEESNYTYTQDTGDGSSMTVQGNKDNTVSVNIENQSSRGDIPDALA